MSIIVDVASCCMSVVASPYKFCFPNFQFTQAAMSKITASAYSTGSFIPLNGLSVRL